MGHKHIPYAVTGVPVAPTPVPLRTVFKARLSEGIQSGFVAVIPPPTALLTRRIRPTGFRSSSIFSYYNGLTGICQGFLGKFFVKILVKIEKTGKNGGIFDGTGERACMWEDFLTDGATARRQMAAWGGAVEQETEPRLASSHVNSSPHRQLHTSPPIRESHPSRKRLPLGKDEYRFPSAVRRFAGDGVASVLGRGRPLGHVPQG